MGRFHPPLERTEAGTTREGLTEKYAVIVTSELAAFPDAADNKVGNVSDSYHKKSIFMLDARGLYNRTDIPFQKAR